MASVRSLRWLVPALGLALVIRHWAWMPAYITGDSMAPTLSQGQLAGVNRLAYRFRRPQRGEIVVVSTDRELMVKRVIGLPGEELEIRRGVIYVNGQPLSEPYVHFKNIESVTPGSLGPNQYLVAGDDRLASVMAVVNGERLVGPLVFWR
jgi:signal peptidase I